MGESSQPFLPSLPAPTSHNLWILEGARRYKLWTLAGGGLCMALGKPSSILRQNFGDTKVPQIPVSNP